MATLAEVVAELAAVNVGLRAEIERRYQRALAASRATGRFHVHASDLWRNCTATPPTDRGPETERGVAFPEAW